MIIMAQSYSIPLYLIFFVVIQVASQTVWVDIDTGKVLGVTQGQGQPQQHIQQQYPQNNYEYHRRRHHWRQPNVGNQSPFIRQPVNTNMNDVNAEWVCRNSKTGDTMIIATDINSRLPEQNQQQPTEAYSPNINNPWLTTNGQHPQPNNPEDTSIEQNNPQNPIFNGENHRDNYPAPLPTEAPIILTTKPSVKHPFPTLENIDWSKYIDTTTKKSTATSLNSAIDGEGILTARGGDPAT